MELAITLLAVLGFGIVLLRLARASWRVARRGLELFLARAVAAARARRGDLTGMAEARERVAAARRSGLRAFLRLAAWLAVLAAPALIPWGQVVYASYFLAWLTARGVRELRAG
ncbi:MAG: hypothetical protein HY703_05685 [Gemmatimonadetes bacterium]|nr:hypothetical protein [Gemmatimonadota bacterium]